MKEKQLKNSIKKNSILALLVIMVMLSSCKANSQEDAKISNLDENKIAVSTEIANINYIKYIDSSDIKRNLSSLGFKYRAIFSKYLSYRAPNNKPIYILAQNKITDEQLIRAYNILSFYLSNNEFYNKDEVANSIANSNAVLVMPNGSDGDKNIKAKIASAFGQPLYHNEVVVEGGTWYQENDYEHRDATFEEIFHFVHDYGVGTSMSPAALPSLSSEIANGLSTALPTNKSDWGKSGIWGLDSKDWLDELSKEGSLEQEYIVSGIDSYYGFWQAYSDNAGGMWGLYAAKNRAEVKQKDAPAAKIINEFLGDSLSYLARIEGSFIGDYKMYLDENDLYTHKSQYLDNCRLTGSNASNLYANDRNNILIGNSANNIIDGNQGFDIVQFSGVKADYLIEDGDGKLFIKDTKDRDGEDLLLNIEVLRFLDQDLVL